jgi:hypothetical protein
VALTLLRRVTESNVKGIRIVGVTLPLLELLLLLAANLYFIGCVILEGYILNPRDTTTTRKQETRLWLVVVRSFTTVMYICVDRPPLWRAMDVSKFPV